jgi:hypothetical protein
MSVARRFGALHRRSGWWRGTAGPAGLPQFAGYGGVLGGGLDGGVLALCHHGPNHQRRFMSDIGIFSTWDIIVMILVACAPGLVIGAGIGAWVGAGKNPGRRLKGATVFGLTGFALAFAGWWLYLMVIK